MEVRLLGGTILDCDCDLKKLGFGSNDVDGTRDTGGAAIRVELVGAAGILEGLGT